MLSDSSSEAIARSNEPFIRRPAIDVLFRVAFALGVFFVSQIAAAILVVLLAAAFGLTTEDKAAVWIEQSVAAQFFYILIAETIVVVALVLFLRAKKESLRSVGVTSFRANYTAYALLGYGIYFFVYIGLATAIYFFVPSIDIEQEQDIGFDEARGLVGLGLTFVSLVVIPPLVEEFLFRGFIFSALRKRVNIVLTSLVVSVLFALGHLQIGNGTPLLWIAAIDTFVLSVILCAIREKTGSIWPGVIIHALKNGVAFTALFLVAT